MDAGRRTGRSNQRVIACGSRLSLCAYRSLRAFIVREKANRLFLSPSRYLSLSACFKRSYVADSVAGGAFGILSETLFP